MTPSLRIGTRRSPLAVWQAEHVRARLEAAHPGLRCLLVRIVTEGDRILDRPLAQVGGKGLFVKEIENALLDGRIDVAVHSMKDLPAELPQGLRLGAVPQREDPRDALVAGQRNRRLADIPPGARIGTSSLRRAAQLRFHRPDLTLEPARGNVETRIRRLEEGRFDAIVLAVAGLKRLGLESRISEILEPDLCLPAVGQGVLAVEIREDDPETARLVEPLNDPATETCVRAERAFLAAMGGSCQIPVAALAHMDRENLALTGLVADLDGSQCVRLSLEAPPDQAVALGHTLADQIRAAGGDRILQNIARRLSARS
jgi:hydroxymethylbilane synthase